MTRLTILDEAGPGDPVVDTTDAERIAAALAAIGVGFERWAAQAPLPPSARDADILAAYAPQVEQLRREGGYQSVDVARVTPDAPGAAEMRGKFLAEHTHADDEVRFFVEGRGMFYLRAGGQVHMVLCEAGDLLRAPAGIPHWFDMGPRPRFTAIRLFRRPDGWVADFTGDAIAARFPAFEATE